MYIGPHINGKIYNKSKETEFSKDILQVNDDIYIYITVDK